jgi:predicted N-acetyltransferase YhbS
MKAGVEYLADHDYCLPQVAAWQHAEFGYLNPTGTLEQRAAKLRQSMRSDSLPIALVALDGGRLVGSASILKTTLTHQHLTPWLSSVFVPAEFRGQGIASLLSLRAAAEAARFGFGTLYLFTPHNESLYARIGWTTFDEVIHNGRRLAIMGKTVAC